MSVLNVDYDALEQCNRNINLCEGNASSISLKINSVIGNIDPRVASRCSGISSLTSMLKKYRK